MEYVSIRTATLRGDQKITFDVHVHVAGKFITYLRKGDSFEGARLDRLKAKKLKKMFIRPDDESLYREYVDQNIESAYDKTSSKSMEERSNVIQGAQQSSAEAVMENPEDQANYQQAKSGTARYVDFLLNEQKAAQSMLNIANTDRDLAHHGVSVSTISVSIAQALGIQGQQLELMALGALLHDLAHAGQTRELFKPVTQLTGEQKEAYLRHPREGVESARQHRHFDETVLNIILQHEELCDGSGYPDKLIEKNTNPLSVIVSTANDFDRTILNEKIARAEVIKKFTMERMGLHPLNQIQALKRLI